MMKHLLMILALLVVACGGEFHGDTFSDVGGGAGELGTAGDASAGSTAAGSGGSSSAGAAGSTSTVGGSTSVAGTAGTMSAGAAGEAGAGGSGGEDDCSDPSLDTVQNAVLEALPESFTWQDFSTIEFDGSCYRQTICRDEPCGVCSVSWSNPRTIADGSQVLVDFEGTCADIPTKLVCEMSDFNCVMSLTGSGTLTVYLQAPTHDASTVSWTVSAAELTGEWVDAGTCTYPHEEAASGDLMEELDLTLDQLSVAATCG